ncbi:glycosyltransferase, partial [bacterium]|nr:glycosyltransferase [bacterium]
FFGLNTLGDFLEKISKLPESTKIIFTPHSVNSPGFEMKTIKDSLRKVDQIHILKNDDAKDLKKQTDLANIAHFPHGNATFTRIEKEILKQKLDLQNNYPVIATHGFMVPNKGCLEALESIKLLKKDYPDILYLAINAVNRNNIDSADLAKKFSDKIIELDLEENVIHIDDFLDREEILLLLSAADVLIFPYGESKEAASGAVRLALATENPIIYTNTKQLSDLVQNDIGVIIQDNQSKTITDFTKNLIENKHLHHKIRRDIRKYSEKNNWDMLKLKYLKLISDLSD